MPTTPRARRPQGGDQHPDSEPPRWRGQDVLDPQGDKLGKLEEIYYDTETDVPAFAAVKSGTLSKHLTIVPLSEPPPRNPTCAST